MDRRRAKRRALLGLFALGALLFAGLGAWQVDRLAWKRDLIARVEARVHAAPVAAPGAGDWARIVPEDAEYRRVAARGVFLHDRETLVDALTELGPGAWVMTPLRTGAGTILVNRGFVPADRRAPAMRAMCRPPGEARVVGLLRLSEPGGRFLRPNVPANDRWFSRDVDAIAKVRGLDWAAPFFIDAERAAAQPGCPVGGLTVVRFRNAHLAYALTWFALAAGCLAALAALLRERRYSLAPGGADMGPG